MTRVICVAPLIDSARLFMQSELGWEIEERDELGSDADAAVAIVEAAPLGQARARCLAGAAADRLGARRAGQRRSRRGDGARDSGRARARSQCGVRRRVHDRRDDRAAPPHRLHPRARATPRADRGSSGAGAAPRRRHLAARGQHGDGALSGIQGARSALDDARAARPRRDRRERRRPRKCARRAGDRP